MINEAKNLSLGVEVIVLHEPVVAGRIELTIEHSAIGIGRPSRVWHPRHCSS